MLESRKLRLMIALSAIATLILPANAALARDYTSGEGGATEIDACANDAAKFCHDEIMWQHEMEECLQQHVSQISKACRAQIQPFSFKKYYNQEPHLF